MKSSVPILSVILLWNNLESTTSTSISDECCRQTDICNDATYPYQIPSLDLSAEGAEKPRVDGLVDVEEEYSRFLRLSMFSGEKEASSEQIGTAYIAYDCSGNVICAAARLDEDFLQADPSIQVDQDDNSSYVRFGQHHGALTLIASKSDEFAYVSHSDDRIIGYEGCWSVQSLLGIQSIVNNYVDVRFTNNREVTSTAVPESSWENVCLTTNCDEPPFISPSDIRFVRVESTTGEMIQMFEVLAYTPQGLEVAAGKVAKQSSTWKNKQRFDAHNAIDGDHSTFSHTSAEDKRASWEVDLLADFEISNVRIHNRFCRDASDTPGCLCRLTSAVINLVDSFGNVVSSLQLRNTCSQMILNVDFTTTNRMFQ